jgi:hypothetical protein
MNEFEELGSIGMIITGTALVCMLFAAALWKGNEPAAVTAFVAMLLGYGSNVAFAYECPRIHWVLTTLCFGASVASVALLTM